MAKDRDGFPIREGTIVEVLTGGRPWTWTRGVVTRIGKSHDGRRDVVTVKFVRGLIVTNDTAIIRRIDRAHGVICGADGTIKGTIRA